MMRPVALFFWLFAIALALPARASCPLSLDTINLITEHFKRSLGFVNDVDRANLGRALAFLQKGGPETIQRFERLVNDLRGRAVENIEGVANVRHLVLAVATARSEQQAHAYIRGLDRFWHLRTDGLSNADSLGNGATSNIRRVASRNMGELFEIAAASWLVDNNLAQVGQFEAFGRQMRLSRLVPGEHGFAEADFLLNQSGQSFLFDGKFTERQALEFGFENFSEDQVRRWARGLRDGDFGQVRVPTNGTLRPGVETRIAEIFEAEGAQGVLDRFAFVFVSIPGF